MLLLTSLLTDSRQESFQPSNPRSQVGILQQPPDSESICLTWRPPRTCPAQVKGAPILWGTNQSPGALCLEFLSDWKCIYLTITMVKHKTLRIFFLFNFMKLLTFSVTFAQPLGFDFTAGIGEAFIISSSFGHAQVTGGIMSQKMVEQSVETSVKISP